MKQIELHDHWKFYKREAEKDAAIEAEEREQEECEHQYAERCTSPLGVVCIKCGHFVGAWE